MKTNEGPIGDVPVVYASLPSDARNNPIDTGQDVKQENNS